MSDHTKIEWTDASWNPIRARNIATGKIGWHCVHASEGCRNCYAETFNKRLGTSLDYKPGNREHLDIFLDEKLLTQPLHWKRGRKIFVGSMTDLFADFVADDMLDRIFAVMALCPQHTFQLLTKRPERMRAYVCDKSQARSDGRGEAVFSLGYRDPFELLRWPLPNVWLGVSCEDRPNLLDRAGHLRNTPAAKRFLSCEPLLSDLGTVLLDGLDWVICGGESGPNARPMHPDWARSLRDQCTDAAVPFFFKQFGEWAPAPWKLARGENEPVDDYKTRSELVAATHAVSTWGSVHQFSHKPWSIERGEPVGQDQAGIRRFGKRHAGRLLDGVEHNAFPPL